MAQSVTPQKTMRKFCGFVTLLERLDQVAQKNDRLDNHLSLQRAEKTTIV